MRRALILIAAGAAGCAPSHSIVGQWSTRSTSGDGTMIFRPDNTFRSYTESSYASLVLDGTYEVKGCNLRLHVDKWAIAKGPDLSGEAKRTMQESLQNDAFSSLTWADENHLRLSAPSGDLTTAERVSK